MYINWLYSSSVSKSSASTSSLSAILPIHMLQVQRMTSRFPIEFKGIPHWLQCKPNTRICEWEGIRFFQVSRLRDVILRDKKQTKHGGRMFWPIPRVRAIRGKSFFSRNSSPKVRMRIMHGSVLSAVQFGIWFFYLSIFGYFCNFQKINSPYRFDSTIKILHTNTPRNIPDRVVKPKFWII